MPHRNARGKKRGEEWEGEGEERGDEEEAVGKGESEVGEDVEEMEGGVQGKEGGEEEEVESDDDMPKLEGECQALVQVQRTTAQALMRGSIRRCPTSVTLPHPLTQSPAHPLATSTYLYLLVPTCTHLYLPLPASVYLYLPLPTYTHLYLPLPTSTYLYLPLPTSAYLCLTLPRPLTRSPAHPLTRCATSTPSTSHRRSMWSPEISQKIDHCPEGFGPKEHLFALTTVRAHTCCYQPVPGQDVEQDDALPSGQRPAVRLELKSTKGWRSICLPFTSTHSHSLPPTSTPPPDSHSLPLTDIDSHSLPHTPTHSHPLPRTQVTNNHAAICHRTGRVREGRTLREAVELQVLS